MRYRLFVSLGLVLSTLAPNVRADAQLVSPLALYSDLMVMLPQLGVTPLPIGYSAPGLPGGRINLLRGRMIAGQVEYTQNLEEESADFKVFDSQNRLIAWASQRWNDCHPGRCLDVTFSTLHDDSKGFPAPFEVRSSPGVGLYFLQYGQTASPLYWQRNLLQTVQWLQGVIAGSPGVLIRSSEPREAMFLALGGHPNLAPYLSNIQILSWGGRIHVVGTVPSSAVYSEFALAAMDYEYGHYDLDLTILTPNAYLDAGYPTYPGGMLFQGDM